MKTERLLRPPTIFMPIGYTMKIVKCGCKIVKMMEKPMQEVVSCIYYR